MRNQTVKKSGRPVVYGKAEDQCVWSRAGVTKPIKCINAFDCLGCSLDRKVQANFEAKEAWHVDRSSAHRTARLRMLGSQLKCRHMLSGRVDYKLCAHNYNCIKCPYDQMIEDTGYMPGFKPPVCEQVSGFTVPRDHYFHYGHTWARVEYGGRVRVGLDDFALRLLGPQDEIQLPRLGAKAGQGKHLAVLKREGNEALTLSPVDGHVVAVNHKLKQNASTANDSPYYDGWFMVVQPANLRRSLKNLFFGTESLAWMDDEATRLNTLLSEETGYRMAATGGEAVRDIYGSVPGIGWDRLIEEFLG
ncbi:MAG: glycine cleavage system protein H [Deltaproteobacteria bacterium]|nr:glycine cleavage system protein H [Deltaproteobacteria bacterium]MBW2296430.1 glycine cleavage system protein H [Deltaproteobacteria bacterium]MBW2676228.1 glycine cleavage system protein H [Deltaproteobacteria bacterium]